LGGIVCIQSKLFVLLFANIDILIFAIDSQIIRINIIALIVEIILPIEDTMFQGVKESG